VDNGIQPDANDYDDYTACEVALLDKLEKITPKSICAKEAAMILSHVAYQYVSNRLL